MLSTTSYAVLGLLSFAPMSGYDLRSAAERTVARFWPISKTKVYGELQRLEQAGFVEGVDVVQERYPDKRVYRLTEAGGKALDAWLDEPTTEEAVLRMPFLIRTLFGHRRPPAVTRAVIDHVAATAGAEVEALATYARDLAPNADAAYAALVIDCGARIAEAIASWAEEAKGRLPEVEIRIDPRRTKATQARQLLDKAPTTSKRHGG